MYLPLREFPQRYELIQMGEFSHIVTVTKSDVSILFVLLSWYKYHNSKRVLYVRVMIPRMRIFALSK